MSKPDLILEAGETVHVQFGHPDDDLGCVIRECKIEKILALDPSDNTQRVKVRTLDGKYYGIGIAFDIMDEFDPWFHGYCKVYAGPMKKSRKNKKKEPTV
ncbi:MAG TPA: hypothetical protein VN843_30840 [Anaerolineales bacterium]|nr:hypothetical protein [Anaerolineales bacterium]